MSDLAMTPITKLKCMYPDCGNEWSPRSDRLPLVCPRCKRYDWNNPHSTKPRKNKKGTQTPEFKGGVKDEKVSSRRMNRATKKRKHTSKPSAIERFKGNKSKMED